MPSRKTSRFSPGRNLASSKSAKKAAHKLGKTSKKGKASRYTTLRSPRSRRAPSPELKEAMGEIVEIVRPELTKGQLHRVTDIVAREVRPHAKAVDLRQVRQTRKAIARAIGDQSEAPLPSSHPLH